MSIASAQRHHGYPTVEDYTLSKRKIEVLGDIDFQKFGGINEYKLCRNIYWYIQHKRNIKEDSKLDDRITKEQLTEASIKFGQTVDEVERRNKLFRRWLNEPVKRYE